MYYYLQESWLILPEICPVFILINCNILFKTKKVGHSVTFEFSLPPKNLDEYFTRKLKTEYNLSPIKKRKKSKKRKKQSSSLNENANDNDEGRTLNSEVKKSKVLDLTGEKAGVNAGAKNLDEVDEDMESTPVSKKSRGNTEDLVVESPQRGNSPRINQNLKIKNNINSSGNSSSNLNQSNLNCSNVLILPHPSLIQIQSPPPMYTGYIGNRVNMYQNNLALSPMDMDMTLEDWNHGYNFGQYCGRGSGGKYRSNFQKNYYGDNQYGRGQEDGGGHYDRGRGRGGQKSQSRGRGRDAMGYYHQNNPFQTSMQLIQGVQGAMHQFQPHHLQHQTQLDQSFFYQPLPNLRFKKFKKKKDKRSKEGEDQEE